MSNLVLDEAVLITLAAHPNVAAEFPVLATVLKSPPESCKSCGQRAASRIANTNEVKQYLLSMSDERKARFKQLVGVTTVSLKLANNGSIVSASF